VSRNLGFGTFHLGPSLLKPTRISQPALRVQDGVDGFGHAAQNEAAQWTPGSNVVGLLVVVPKTVRRVCLPFEPRDQASAAGGALTRERDGLTEELLADWA
jgi:hypothetical protein